MSDDALRLIERTDRVLRDLEDAEVQRLNAALDNSYVQLERELLRKYPTYTADSQPGLLATQRGVLLTQELSNVLSLVNPSREQEIQARFERLLQTSSKEGTTLADELMRLQAGDDFVKATATIPIEAVAFEVRDAIQRLKKHDQTFREEASVIISQGLIQGWGAMRTASQLRQRLGVAKGRAETIARTEIISAHDSAARANYKANGINYVQRIATQDSRVCAFCADRAGKVYPVDQAPAAIHPRDRCYNMPWKPEWQEQGRTNEEFIQRHAQDVKRQVEARGEKLRGDRAPFELLAGLTAPKPVWTPAEGWLDKEVERQAQDHALALLVLGLLLAPKPQPGLPIIPIPVPVPQPPEEEDNELLRTLVIGAAITGLAIGTYYVARQRYRQGFRQSAQMAEEMLNTLDLDDVPDEAEFITLVSGGFGGKEGRSGFEQVNQYQAAGFFQTHHLVGVANPNTDRAKAITQDPIGHIATNWGGLLNRAIVEGRNPDAVAMAARAAAYYRKTGKPVNLLGYSAGGFVASEAAEILKLMDVPVRVATVGTPYFGFTDLGKGELRSFMGDGDIVGALPVQNRVTVQGVANHWFTDYLKSEDFATELQGWLNDASPRTVRPPAEEQDWFKQQAEDWQDWIDSVSPAGRYRQGFEKSAEMAREQAKQYQNMARSVRPDEEDAVTFIAGGFAGQKGQASLEYADYFQEFLDTHLVLGVPTPEFDTDIDLRAEPLRHLFESYKTVFETFLVKGRNPSAVRMAAMAYAYYQEHGKPINLVGYSGGGLVAVEAAEILKKMGVPTKTIGVGAPSLGFDLLSANEHLTLMGKGDLFVDLPARNRKILEDVDAHWLNAYLDSPNFVEEMRNFLGVRARSEYRSPQRPTEVTVIDETLVDFIPQLQLLSEDEINLLPAPLAQKVLAARKANLMLPGKADPLLLTGLADLLALPEAVNQIIGLLEGKPEPNLLPGVKELLALPGVKDQIRGLLQGRPDPKLLPSSRELLALPAVAEVRGLLTGRLEPKLLRGIPEPLLLTGLEPYLALPEAQNAIKGLLRGELPPLELPAGIDIRFPQNEQALIARQTTRQLYQQLRSAQRRFSRDAEKKIREQLARIAQENIPPMAKLEKYRQLMFEELRAIATPATQQQAPGTSKPEDLVTFEFAGIQWHVPELKPTSPTLDILRKLVELGLPNELIQAVDNVYLSRQKAAFEEFWRKRLALQGPIPATVNFEDASITAYRGRVKTEDMLRQMGYLFAEQTWGRLEPPRNSEYWLAIANEGRPITTYGFNSTAADFADGVAQFFLDPQRLKRFNPRRYEAIARMVNYRHPESVVPPSPPDLRSPEIINTLRTQNQEIRDQAQQQRQAADAIAQKQRSTKKVQQALTRITNEGELTAQSQNAYAQLRSQDEALDRLEVEVQGLEQRQTQLLNPLNNPYFTEVPPRLRAAKRQLKDIDKQLRSVDKIASTAAKVRANAIELQQTLSDLETRRESLKVSNQGQKIDAAVAQLRSTLQDAEQELLKLPQSPERSQALRDFIRLRATINSQSGGVSVAQLHRDALLPRIQQISQLADELEGLQARLTTTRNKLSDLQTRLARLPQRVADLTPDQQAQYSAIKRTRIAQSKLPARVENYRTIHQSYSGQLAEQGQNTQKLADDYQGQRQSALNNVSSFVETRLQRIQDRLTILTSLRPESVAWLLESRNWDLGAIPDDLAIVLASRPGKTTTEKLKAASDEIYRLISETAGAANAIEKRLNYPNELADTTLARVQANKQQWQRVRDALVDEDTLSDAQIKKLLDDPTKIKPIDVIRYGNQLLRDLEQFQADFVTLLLQDDRTDPKTIIDQAELYRQSRDRFSQELAQHRAQIAREIEDALAIADALEQRLQRDKAEPLIYDINGKARTADDIKAELEQVKALLVQLRSIRQVNINPKVNEYLNPERSTERQQELQAFERRQQRFQELKDQLTAVNREIQKRREAAARGQKRGINTDRLEAEQRQIIDEIANLAREDSQEAEAPQSVETPRSTEASQAVAQPNAKPVVLPDGEKLKNNLEKIETVGNQAKNFYKATVDGNEFFVKEPKTPIGAKAEEIAKQLADDLGIGQYFLSAKVVEIDGKPHVVTPFVRGEALNDDFGINDRAIADLIVFDLLIGNEDRNLGNLLKVDGQLIAIDHEDSFGRAGIKRVLDNNDLFAYLEEVREFTDIPLNPDLAKRIFETTNEYARLLEENGLDATRYRQRALQITSIAYIPGATLKMLIDSI